MTTFCHAQNFIYDYRLVRLDSTFDAQIDPRLQKYVDEKRSKLEKEMMQVIGQCDEALYSFSPASPLSNFLSDMLLENASIYTTTSGSACDIAILNFGGIRSNLPAGEVTIGDIYRLSPFNNTIVILDIQGSELRKAIQRFPERNCSAAFAGMQVSYLAGRPYKILIGGNPINDDRTYQVVTLDFIAGGGDNILSDIHFTKTTNTDIVYRDFIITGILNMTKAGKTIQAKKDNRVVILPQP